MSGRWALAATVTVGLAASAVAIEASPAAGASYPDDLVWLALGDSYSSGEGLRYVDQDANPAGKTCERATGRTSVNDGQGSSAWAAVAYDQVRGEMTDSTFRLLACTGAISNEIHAQYRDEWLAGGEPRADLITFSMGGNNLGFADVVKRCIGLSIDNSTGAGIVLNPAIGCDTTETELKAAIDQLVGTSGVGPDGGQTLRDMYREIAENAINPGGHIIVAGYPNIVEESSRWTMGWLEGNRCSRIRRSDTAMLRSATGYLNQQLANLVAEVNGQYNNVSFHWLDVSQIYENDSGRHGLCTGDPWINGLTVGLAGPNSGLGPIRYERSFHPNQKGHDATGTATANIISNLNWTNLQRTMRDPACPSRDEALEVIQQLQFHQFVRSVSELKCQGEVAAGTAFTQYESYAFALVHDGATWKFEVGGRWALQVCRAVWDYQPTFDIGCGIAADDTEPPFDDSYASLDQSETWAFESINLSAGTAQIRRWDRRVNDENGWRNLDATTVAVAPSFQYLRLANSPGDGTSSLDEFADWVNSRPEQPYIRFFWVARDGEALTAAAVAWEMDGTGECVEISIPPLDDNC